MVPQICAEAVLLHFQWRRILLTALALTGYFECLRMGRQKGVLAACMALKQM